VACLVADVGLPAGRGAVGDERREGVVCVGDAGEERRVVRTCMVEMREVGCAIGLERCFEAKKRCLHSGVIRSSAARSARHDITASHHLE
jgi:hypothetical protein